MYIYFTFICTCIVRMTACIHVHCTLYMYMCTLAETNKTIGAAEPDLTQN